MKPQEAIVLLESLKLMFSNDKGEAISDVYYALELAINSLKLINDTEINSTKIYISNNIIEDIRNGCFGKKYTLADIANIIMQGFENEEFTSTYEC